MGATGASATLRHSRVATDDASLARYERIFRRSFAGATHLDAGYLRWLYAQNPAGPVVGFDAFDGDTLAAHYVCVPADVELDGVPVRALLSLNTATDPDYRGKGLFTALAQRTYEAGAAEGFDHVFGVANANSTPGFTGKLRFQLVAPLEARIGFGTLGVDWSRARGSTQFRRRWDRATLEWRTRNPANPVATDARSQRTLALRARTPYAPIRAYAELPDAPAVAGAQVGAAPLRLFIGLVPAACGRLSARWIEIPRRLRPSPLNLIFLDLRGAGRVLDPSRVQLSFLDFDAY